MELESADGHRVSIGGSKERAVLALLSMHANEVVSQDFLIDALWGEEAPRTAARTLQGYVSRVRNALAEAGADARSVLDTSPGGWVLRLRPAELDVLEAERLVDMGRESTLSGDPLGAALAYADALRGWRGRPLAEFADEPWAMAEASRLEELRQHVVEERVTSELACGRHAQLVGELDSLCRSYPLRERLWSLRMLALYRSGRQAEALRAFQALRSTLADELGLDPSPELTRLEQAILDHDPSIDWVATAPARAIAESAASERPSAAPTGVVTVIFTDIGGSTELLTRLGDEVFDRVRQAHFRLLGDTVSRARGTVVKTMGDGLMAVFQDPGTGLACAVAIQQAVARRNRRSVEERLGVRIGVQVGSVTVEAGDYFGAPVVVAKRLCDRAAEGEILTTALAGELLGSTGRIELIPLGPLEIKGLEAPVSACRVEWSECGPRALPDAVSAQRQISFVGRHAELADLDAAWQRVQGGVGEVVLLAGEPGIGKTALAIRAAEAAWRQGAHVLFGRCDEDSVIAFQPWVEALTAYAAATGPEILRAQLGHRASDLAVILPGLEQLLPEVSGIAGGSDETERYRAFAAVGDLIATIAEEAPVVLVLDDLHWADQPTLQLLLHVMRTVRDRAVLLLGAYRDTDLVRTHPMAEVLVELRRAELVRRLPVRGLNRDDVRALVGGSAANAGLVEALWEETEGSPLFLREILRHLEETGAVERTAEGEVRPLRRLAQLGIPEGVREVIGRRLTRLSPAANTSLRTGSVQGREMWLSVLERVTELGSDELLEAMDDATAAGVVEEVPGVPGRWTFTHALVRQSLYDELSLTRRVRLHQQVGEALEAVLGSRDGPHLAQLAFHFTQAALTVGPDLAIAYARRAGDYAMTTAAYEEAARHYAIALDVAADSGVDNELRIDLLVAQARAEWRVSADPRVPRATLERAISLLSAGDAERLALIAAEYSGAHLLWVNFNVSQRAVELLERAVAALPGDDGPLRARVLSALAHELYFAPGLDPRCDLLSGEAVAMARRIGDLTLLGYVLTSRNVAILGPDTVTEVARNADEVIHISRRIRDRHLEALGLAHKVFTAFDVDDMDAFRAGLVEALRLADELHDPHSRLLGIGTTAGIACSEGRFEEAERLFLEMFRIGQETRNPMAFFLIGPGLGAVRLLQGRVVEQIGTTAEYVDVFPIGAGIVKGILAMVHAECGMPEQARTLLLTPDYEDPKDLPRNLGYLYALHPPSRACFLLGEKDLAAHLYQLQLPYAGRNAGLGAACYGKVDFGLGLAAAAAGWYDKAEEHFAAATEGHERNGWWPWVVESVYFHALMLERADRPSDRQRALEMAAQVVTAAEGLGMVGRVADGRSLIARLGGQPEPAGGKARTVVRRRDRAKARVAARGRAAAASWSKGKTDEELVRRFTSNVAQRGLFAGMARAFQPAMAFRFEGDFVFELRPFEDDGDPETSDWWTIEIRKTKATARRGRSETPTVTMRSALHDFVRIAAGEVHPARALLEGTLEVDGDVMAAARMPDLFGMVEPVDGAEYAVP